jgi:hypothetical protein
LSEYVITPDDQSRPSGHHLMEELHRRGLPVEINVKGTAEEWDSIRFYEPGPPEIECFLSHEPSNGQLNVSISVDSSLEARDLQMFLVDILLKKVGGRVDHTGTRERYTAEEFSKKVKSLHGSSAGETDLQWILFSWVMVAISLLGYCVLPRFNYWALAAGALSLAGALGLTIPKFRSK